MKIKGKRSTFVKIGPEELGMDKYEFAYENVPFITDRIIDLKYVLEK